MFGFSHLSFQWKVWFLCINKFVKDRTRFYWIKRKTNIDVLILGGGSCNFQPCFRGWVSHFCAEGRGWAMCFFFFFNHISKCSGPLHWKCFLGYPEYFSISGNAFYKRCYEIGNIATSNRYRKQVSVGCPWRLDEEHLKRRHLQVDFVLPAARFYHGYQMFFLVCGEELRRPQTDTCSAESRTETGNAHEKYILAPRVARFYLCPKTITTQATMIFTELFCDFCFLTEMEWRRSPWKYLWLAVF